MFETFWALLIEYLSLLYWVPLIGCLFCYGLRCSKELRADVVDRRNYLNGKSNGYYPKLTVGSVAGRLLLSLIPAVNLISFVFDGLGDILELLGRTLAIPLVPKKERAVK
jgi:hypothetical protein